MVHLLQHLGGVVFLRFLRILPGGESVGHTVIGPHAGRPVGEAAGARGGEGVDQGVEQGHPRQLQQEDLHRRHDEVDAVEDLGGLGLLGYQLGEHRAGALRLGQIVGAHPHGGQQGGGQHQNAHSPQPVGEGPPQENALG